MLLNKKRKTEALQESLNEIINLINEHKAEDNEYIVRINWITLLDLVQVKSQRDPRFLDVDIGKYERLNPINFWSPGAIPKGKVYICRNEWRTNLLLLTRSVFKWSECGQDWERINETQITLEQFLSSGGRY